MKSLEDYLPEARERILVALDVDGFEPAETLVYALGGYVGGFKIGLELFNAMGPDVFTYLRTDNSACRFFYDVKLHDIPNTVAGAVRAATAHGLWMINVHASGGAAMLKAAVEAAQGVSASTTPYVIGVTVLTSLDDVSLRETYGHDMRAADLVVHQAKLCQECGLDGVVCSAHEVTAIRQACGDNFIIVVPGIRMADNAANDQKRIATPYDATRAGARYLVLGRAITHAPDKAQAAQAVALEIARALRDNEEQQ